MRVDVVTVFSPRDDYPQWPLYLPILEMQRDNVHNFPDHHHVVVSDNPARLPGFNVLEVWLPQNLMKMILAAQVAYLEQWDDSYPVVLVDVDCFVGCDLSRTFNGKFDIGLTRRSDAKCPINNGAMYVSAGARTKALEFFRTALSICEDHWGGDQEAISRAAAPVPSVEGIWERNGTRFAFFSMKTHNVIPEKEGAFHKRKPYIIHFKGEKKKPWMKTYYDLFLKKR